MNDGLLNKAIAEKLGWQRVHGGPEENGAFWRGVNPLTNKVEEIPDYISILRKATQQ